MILQRLRVEFAKREAIQFISHLDLLRVWLRSLRRAGIPLAYSEGYVARPKISLAAPLAVGATGEAELLDIYLHRRMTPLTFMKAIRAYLPEGIEVNSTEDVPRSLPSLQSLVHAADYAVSGAIVDAASPATTVEQAISALLASETFLWEHQR
ncbi:MAG: TIGR03936 family radical SAM-associated protein, partial [Chloroflexi bacterium]|nr:TIGR03936 family radical SAM-associated protein [Chloroflexota bacterium]